jgi:hypothetical protein
LHRKLIQVINIMYEQVDEWTSSKDLASAFETSLHSKCIFRILKSTGDSRYTRCYVPTNRRVFRKRVEWETFNMPVYFLSDTPWEVLICSPRSQNGGASQWNCARNWMGLRGSFLPLPRIGYCCSSWYWNKTADIESVCNESYLCFNS